MRRSDIFSFGAILYEMLAGRRAFHGDSAADTMSAILREDPPELSLTNQNLPPGLERIVRHCLEKNPEQRFHSAHDRRVRSRGAVDGFRPGRDSGGGGDSGSETEGVARDRRRRGGRRRRPREPSPPGALAGRRPPDVPEAHVPARHDRLRAVRPGRTDDRVRRGMEREALRGLLRPARQHDLALSRASAGGYPRGVAVGRDGSFAQPPLHDAVPLRQARSRRRRSRAEPRGRSSTTPSGQTGLPAKAASRSCGTPAVKTISSSRSGKRSTRRRAASAICVSRRKAIASPSTTTGRGPETSAMCRWWTAKAGRRLSRRGGRASGASPGLPAATKSGSPERGRAALAHSTPSTDPDVSDSSTTA